MAAHGGSTETRLAVLPVASFAKPAGREAGWPGAAASACTKGKVVRWQGRASLLALKIMFTAGLLKRRKKRKGRKMQGD